MIGKKVYDFLGSYALCCVLLGFLFILTFLGTIEQTEMGLYEVQKKYFESLFLVHWVGGRYPLPLPGVYLVLIALTINLTIGGLVRIRKSSATLGVIVIHVGILIMFAAGFVKLKFSSDGQLKLYEGQRSEDYHAAYEWEIAVWDAAQPANVTEFLIADADFDDLKGEKTRTFEEKDLPIKLELSHYERNSMVYPKGPKWDAAGPTVDGFALKAEPPQPEAEINYPGVYVTVAGNPQILWAGARWPLVFDGGGKKWAVALRKKRYKMPFSVRLEKFTHEVYPNTTIPKVYASDVAVSEGSTERQCKIEMNAPLRDRGVVLFQADYGPKDPREPPQPYSVFAVVENPSDQWPLISCIVIAIGMILAFSQKLYRYMLVQESERKAAA